jgi:RecA/RadA recombinase
MTNGYVPFDAALEGAVCGVLMRDVGRRQEFVGAGATVDLFHDDEMKELATICLQSGGRVTPDLARHARAWTVDVDGLWRHYTVEAGDAFVLLVARLGALARQRGALELSREMCDRLGMGEERGVDAILARFSDGLSGVVNSARGMVDPSAEARIAALCADIEAGRAAQYVPTGIPEVDSAVGGIDFGNSDVWVLNGAPKVGKTRTLLNVVGNLYQAMGDGLRVCWLSSEVGFTPERLLSILVAQQATRMGLVGGELRGDGGGVSPRSIITGAYRALACRNLVKRAMEQVASWGLFVYGPALKDGNARLLDSAVNLATLAIDVRRCNLVVVDNFQQMIVPDLFGGRVENTAYQTMVRAVPAFTRVTMSRGAVLLGISQMNASEGVMGGRALEFEANALFDLVRGKGVGDCEYDVKARLVREGPSFGVRVRVDGPSGLILSTSPLSSD